ncbi:MAG: Rid family hydrolase [Caldilineaceae bacterium]
MSAATQTPTTASWEAMTGYSRRAPQDRLSTCRVPRPPTKRGNLVGGDDPAAQARYAIQKIERALSNLGGELADGACRVFVSDIANWEPVARVYGEFFS